jgi:hypothetical protein
LPLALQGDVTSKKGIQSPQVTATAGTVSTQSSLTSINPFPLKGRSMAVSGSGCNLKAQNDQVVFNCPSIQVGGPLPSRLSRLRPAACPPVPLAR